jgi:nucleotide-binding universal stress UspA family protein
LRGGRDRVPDGMVAVVLASTGVPFGEDAIRAAAERAAGAAVAVVSIARLHGYAFGMPNPGLMPTRKEKQQQVDLVEQATRRLEGWAVACDGQVVISRNPAKAIARVAARRGAGLVVLQAAAGGGLRRLAEGDPARRLRRRLRGRCEVSTWYG